MIYPCHSKPQNEWCDHSGPGGFMGHTCTKKMDTLEQVLADIRLERARQFTKWGRDRDDSLERWMVILVEEVGEAARCVLERHPKQQTLPGDWLEKLRTELVQVASVAVAAIEEIDKGTHN